MIKLIKLIHTIIWAIMAFGCIYILYAGLTNTFNMLLYVSLVLVIGESVVLIFNKWTCPLTPLAEKYTNDRNPNFGIYLPNWLAKYNKEIFGVIFSIGLILVIINWIKA